jgi:hypothetical protein
MEEQEGDVAILYAYNIRAARARVGDYNNTVLQQAAAGLEYLYSG